MYWYPRNCSKKFLRDVDDLISDLITYVGKTRHQARATDKAYTVRNTAQNHCLYVGFISIFTFYVSDKSPKTLKKEKNMSVKLDNRPITLCVCTLCKVQKTLLVYTKFTKH